jgi:Undecaprenyl-phosphate glucose phosphotransferase
MVKEHHRLFRNLLLLTDICVILASWAAAYFIRFATDLIPVAADPHHDRTLYLMPVAVIPILWPTIFRFLDLYRPRRLGSLSREAIELLQASTLAVLVFIALAYLIFKTEISRIALVLFWIISTGALVATRIAFRETLRFVRRRGFNLRTVLVVGTGSLSEALVQRIQTHLEAGLRVVGFLAREKPPAGTTLHGISVVGGYGDVEAILRDRRPDQVVIALPFEDQAYLPGLLTVVERETVDVKVVPDFLQFASLRGGVEDFDGLAIVNLRASPLVGWNSVAKRAFDLLFGGLAFVLATPLMVIIGLIVKFTDGGPVFYRQERMGLDGRVFKMLKFRSMRVDAEVTTGPVWAKANDSRVTWIGRILRRTSLDELPQLWNVLKGEMSLAGPRPERPALVERFRTELPQYMLRHKIKAGMTGWAQVNGWRGDTSLERRLEHDLYYIQNWSIRLDLKILWLTVWRGFVNPHAY